ncbi:GNAT family N-acetyltransferase [Youxingia wuxianensis]|uniref:GNAT family N-acetyltransferase n=1 Tax=Youxingia wuxianensis TaxID=2763678 RepID=A0A926ENR3_9FIRM|nr:GNAT family N-acetyltransferase [Youxingia wuxianensis]MBC8585986.1 GNAT family N-acetyltransferase [Youxingia wuxianensis]
MIQYVAANNQGLFEKICGTSGIFGSKIYFQYKQYEGEGPLDFWVAWDEQWPGAAVVSICEGNFAVGNTADFISGTAAPGPQELAYFLQTMGFGSVSGELPLIEQLHGLLGGKMGSSYIMNYTAQRTPGRPAAEIRSAQRLEEVYRLLCLCDPIFQASSRYDAWLVDASYKIRHELGNIYALYVENILISTICINFSPLKHAIITSLATHPDFRGKGYGKQLVTYATREVLSRGQIPTLLTANERLGEFYEQCGYNITGRWASILSQKNK